MKWFEVICTQQCMNVSGISFNVIHITLVELIKHDAYYFLYPLSVMHHFLWTMHFRQYPFSNKVPVYLCRKLFFFFFCCLHPMLRATKLKWYPRIQVSVKLYNFWKHDKIKFIKHRLSVWSVFPVRNNSVVGGIPKEGPKDGLAGPCPPILW